MSLECVGDWRRKRTSERKRHGDEGLVVGLVSHPKGERACGVTKGRQARKAGNL